MVYTYKEGMEKKWMRIYIYYTVKKGDTLSGIAYSHNMTLKQIIELNPQIPNPNLIYPGQKICIIKEK